MCIGVGTCECVRVEVRVCGWEVLFYTNNNTIDDNNCIVYMKLVFGGRDGVLEFWFGNFWCGYEMVWMTPL